jgi:hypothetical protein
MPVGMVEHAGKGRLQAREHALLLVAVLGPRLHAVIAGRHFGLWRHQPHRLLALKPLRALDVPAVRERRIITFDDLGGRLMRRMAGAERKPGQPWQIGTVGDVITDEADGLIDQILGQMIAAGVTPWRIDMRVVGDQLRRVLVGLRIEKSVEAVEAAPERPAVEGAGGAAFGERGHVPFADHVVAVGVSAQHFRERAGFARDLAAIAGITRVEIGETADADRMMVASGQQRGARGRTHRGGMKARIAQPLARETVDRRRPDLRAVAAEIGKTDVVEQHHQDVGRASRRPRRRRPLWF